MDDKLQRLQRDNEEADRQLETMTAENNSLKKAVDDLEKDLDRIKIERDEANENLAPTMRELGEMA